MPMDNVTLENTQQSISSRDAKSVASVMVNGKWVNLSDTLEQANVKSDVGTVAKQVDAQQEVVSNAVSTANSAVAYANDAVEKSRVNSQAIDDINSAVSDAISDAAVARSDGLRAWNAAQSNVNLIDLNYASASAAISSARTEAIAAADEAKSSASAAQADIVSARSDVAVVQAKVAATRSDVAVAKSDIADTKTSLSSQAESLSSYAAQASAAGNDITTLKSQAGQIEQDIASTKGDVSQLKVSASSASVALSDAAGNISSLQATATSYSAALSDTNSNVASVTATASELETKYADAANDISQIKTDAKGMTQTISNAQGDIAQLKTRADGFDTEFATANGNISKLQTDATGTTQTLANTKSDVAALQSRADGFDAKYATAAGDINTLKANASGFSQTLTNAQGDISTLKSTVSGVQTTLTDAQGNISTLQSDVSGLKKTTSDNAGNIATLQANAQTLTNQMSSAQGDISTLKQTASDFSSKVSGMETSLSDANSKINSITSNGGGRNLALGTSNSWATAPDVNQYNITTIATYANAQAGDVFTVSVDTQSTKTLAYQVWQGTSEYIRNGYVNTFSIASGTTHSHITFTWPSGATQYLIVQLIDNMPDASHASYQYKNVMLEKGIVAHDWSPAPEDTDAKITANTTATEQNKQAIALKADQTTVGNLSGEVSQNTAQLKVQADQISAKVSSSDLDAKSYATQTYTQTQIKQTADIWNANLASIKDGLTQSYTNLSATVDGIQAQVYNSDGSSKITQLSDLVQNKVSSGDFTSMTTQLKDLINQRVQVGNVISQINQEAGGNTLIQVSNGKGSLILDAGTTVFTGDAFIPSAAIADLTADDITTGTLKGVDIDFRNLSGQGVLIKDSTVTFDDGSSGDKAGYLSFSSMPIADWPSGAGGNELQIRYGESLAIVATSDTNSRALFSTANTQIGYHQQGNSSSDWGLTGLKIDNSARHFNLGVWATDSTWARVEATPHNIQMQANDAHAWLYNNNFHIYRDNDGGSATATELQVDGWAWVRGWVEAAGHSQHSALSTKTALQAIDNDEMLEMVNNTDLASFLFKTDVASGETHRHIGLIIDDVHDVAQYQTPQEFIAPNGVSRDDDNMIGALFGAVKALTKRIKTLESKVG